MACKDCLQNCPEIISDQCVQYTGPALAAPFNVCTGDQLPVLEAALVSIIQSLLNGTGPTPQVTTTECTWFQQLFGILPINLNNVLQVLINGECSLYTMITDLTNEFNSSQNGAVIDTGCLTGLPATPTTAQIIQAIITLLCGVNTTVNSFPTTYVRVADLTTLVTPIVNTIISGGSTTSQQYAKMVPYVAYEYYGPLSNFDGSGKGIATLGFDKVYLCNGSNGTPDKRGRVAVGAIRDVPGGSLDPAVDPAVNPNNPNWGLKDKAGETFHTLTVPEMPSHTHTVTDPQHSHTFASGVLTNGTGPFSGVGGGGLYFSTQTSPASTGISINAAGGSQPHNNIQPSIAAYYIMYLP